MSFLRFIRSASTIIFFVLAALYTGTAGAQAQTFTFAVCNKTNQPAYVAISHMISVTDSRFEVEGWWTGAANSRGNIGAFPEGWFYYYAETTGGNWAGTFPLCVQYPGPFSTIHS